METGRRHVVIENMRDDFSALTHAVAQGDPVQVGGKLSYEIVAATITLLDPLDALPTDTGLSDEYFTETQAATSALDLITHFTLEQYEAVYRTLFTAPTSRGAILRCDISWYQMFFRHNLLHMETVIVGSDVIHTLPCDLFAATQLHATCANVMGADVGEHHLHVSCLSVDAEDLSVIDDIKAPNVPKPKPAAYPLGFDAINMSDMHDRVTYLARTGPLKHMSPTEQWYIDRRPA